MLGLEDFQYSNMVTNIGPLSYAYKEFIHLKSKRFNEKLPPPCLTNLD